MLRVLRRRELPWHRRVQARLRDVSGIVVIGDVHGDVRQLAGRPRPLCLDWKPLAGHDPLAWLHWKSRLAVNLVGREREMESLRRWAEGGRGVRARVLSGEGGTGKTRLAAELAQELRDDGWQAGFADLRRSEDGAAVFSTGAEGSLILLDYPEEHREATRELLRDLATLEGDEKLRVLLLSRRGDDLWQPEIDRADAYDIFDEVSLELGPLPVEHLYRIFREARDRIPVPEGTRPPEKVEQEAFATWLEGETAHRRPLFVLAAAIESALEPDRSVVRLQGREVIQALVRRELTRLRDESQDAGLHPEALPRLTALAAIAGGLDTATLRSLASSEDTLELGLPSPEEVLDRLQATGRLIHRDGDRLLPPPTPDLVAAAMLVEVLGQEPELAPERLWAVVDVDVTGGLERVGRLAFDAEVILGLLDQRPSEWLTRILRGQPQRAWAAVDNFFETKLALGLLPAASQVWQVLLEGVLHEGVRANILNNLSVHLSEGGRGEAALRPIEEAVGILRRLASTNPSQYEPDLATCLNNLSSFLSDAGRGEVALEIIQEAVEIRDRLALSDPSRYEPDLAQSLHNFSNRLAEGAHGEAALAAIEKAVDIRRRLVQSGTSRYEPRLALSLNILSNRLAEADREQEALAAIEEAVEIHRRLATSTPARHEPDLATSLNNLSDRLGEVDRDQEALAAIVEAVELLRRLSASNPPRYEPDLALSLNNLSNRLVEVGRGEEALAAVREAAELIKPYARRFPDGLHGGWGRIIRQTLERMEGEPSMAEERCRPSE